MVENGEAAAYTAEINEALEKIKAIEIMGFYLNDASVPLKYAKGVMQTVAMLTQMHDELVAALPPEVVQMERAKGQNLPPGVGKLNANTPPLGVA